MGFLSPQPLGLRAHLIITDVDKLRHEAPSLSDETLFAIQRNFCYNRLPMNWVVFSYSLPAKSRSSPRVTVWRRLGRLGALSTTSGVYVLPARDECVEAFQWLAQETRQAKGEALVMRVEQFEGLTDQQMMDLFNAARRAEYEALDQDATELEKTAKKKGSD